MLAELQSRRSRRPVLFLEIATEATDWKAQLRAPMLEVLAERGVAAEFLDPTSPDADIQAILNSKRYRTLVTDKDTASFVPTQLTSPRPYAYTRIVYCGFSSIGELRASIQSSADAFLGIGYGDSAEIEKALLSRHRRASGFYGA